jgi:hypothetical protein
VNWNIQAKSQQNHSMKYGNISAKLGSVSPSNIVECFTSVKKKHFGENHKNNIYLFILLIFLKLQGFFHTVLYLESNYLLYLKMIKGSSAGVSICIQLSVCMISRIITLKQYIN